MYFWSVLFSKESIWNSFEPYALWLEASPQIKKSGVEVRSPEVMQLLMELTFLSEFVTEEKGNFQTDLSIKISILNYGMKNYDPPLSDSWKNCNPPFFKAQKIMTLPLLFAALPPW